MFHTFSLHIICGVIDGVNITARAFMRPNAVPDNNASFNPSQQYYQLEWSPKDKGPINIYGLFRFRLYK